MERVQIDLNTDQRATRLADQARLATHRRPTTTLRARPTIPPAAPRCRPVRPSTPSPTATPATAATTSAACEENCRAGASPAVTGRPLLAFASFRCVRLYSSRPVMAGRPPALQARPHPNVHVPPHRPPTGNRRAPRRAAVFLRRGKPHAASRRRAHGADRQPARARRAEPRSTGRRLRGAHPHRAHDAPRIIPGPYFDEIQISSRARRKTSCSTVPPPARVSPRVFVAESAAWFLHGLRARIGLGCTLRLSEIRLVADPRLLVYETVFTVQAGLSTVPTRVGVGTN